MMRFKKRAIVFVGILFIFHTTLFAIHLFGQFDLFDNGALRVGKERHFFVHQADRGIKQDSPTSPNPQGRHLTSEHKKEDVNVQKQQVKRPTKAKKGWDEQEVDGKGHPWQQFHGDIGPDALYSEGAAYMTDLLHDLATLKVINASQFRGGTQLKFDITLEDGNRVMAKPMRVSRDHVYKYNGEEPFWLDPERHNSEIASFHLDRLLGFRRVPPCTGRLINLKKEVLDQTKDFNLLSTVFKSDGNTCVIGVCKPWFCNQDHPSCTKGDTIEVSMCQFLPTFEGGIPVRELKYLWSQGHREAKVWKGENICLEYLKDSTWKERRYFLDLIEQGILDFFIRNYDRHHYTVLRKYKNEGCVLHIDNGKGFGNPVEDDATFLAPVYQCCKVRNSTYVRLKELARPESLLSDLLRSSMSHDPIAPVVTESHLQALDRRLVIVLQTIHKCIEDKGEDQVLVQRLDNQ